MRVMTWAVVNLLPSDEDYTPPQSILTPNNVLSSCFFYFWIYNKQVFLFLNVQMVLSSKGQYFSWHGTCVLKPDQLLTIRFDWVSLACEY